MKQFLSIVSALGLSLLFASQGYAQSSNVLDGAYVKETNLTKRVIPYPYLREADVMYKRRIWQEIDLRQKFNHPFYFPLDEIEDRQNLFNVIREALLDEGSLVAYSAGPLNQDDEFTFPLSPDSIRTILNPTTFVKEYDDFGEEIGTTTRSNPLESDKVTRYRIKEDWIWDRQRSERYVRIIGLAPMVEEFDVDGNSQGFKPLFWLYYPLMPLRVCEQRGVQHVQRRATSNVRRPLPKALLLKLHREGRQCVQPQHCLVCTWH